MCFFLVPRNSFERKSLLVKDDNYNDGTEDRL